VFLLPQELVSVGAPFCCFCVVQVVERVFMRKRDGRGWLQMNNKRKLLAGFFLVAGSALMVYAIVQHIDLNLPIGLALIVFGNIITLFAE